MASHPTYHINVMRDYMDRRVTPPKRVTSPTWGPPPPSKQALGRPLKLEVHVRYWTTALWSITKKLLVNDKIKASCSTNILPKHYIER